MQCSVILERGCNSKMKTLNSFKSPYTKESSLDNIVDQLCTRLQDIKDQESTTLLGMPTCSLEQTEAVRRYYAAFPALKKAQESPLQYYLPPPAWCRKNDTKVKMQSELAIAQDWNCKNKKFSLGKERRNSYHGQKKNSRKRYNSYSRSFESKENMPEWMTHEGVWDIETQDPVKEFIRAIAFDEGYATCENTVTDEIKEISQAKFRSNDNMVPDWDDSLDLDAHWVIAEDPTPRARSPMDEELYAKFEAKFDRSIEALWSKDQNTPDDEYQDLPIDFQDLLSSPSDRLFAEPSADKRSLLTESIWSTNFPVARPQRTESPSKIAEGLHDRLRPLNIREPECPRELESFSLYEGEELYDALSTVAETMRSFAAINHSRDNSGFVEVPPRPRRDRLAPVHRPPPAPRPRPPPDIDREDPLTFSRTHFRPIRRELKTEAPRYADGDTFDICGDYDAVEFERSPSGGVYLEGSRERYLEYRMPNAIDYGRLNLTEAQRCPDLEDTRFKLRFPVRQTDAAVQTERGDAWACDECGGSAKKMRPSGIESIWSEARVCECAVEPGPSGASVPPDELSRDWEELLSDISAAHRMYAGDADNEPGVAEDNAVGSDRKRRHSAALRCGGGASCNHPHARFLHCCEPALDRPLTR
ncbi:uncharacterized protein LOC123706577 isoform X1 [Pieris brassicae]|uniref:uncharacterized protein LOC123706577 isoform X1 n=1 Tax=Pieris brassicae TaxID=7116 RepID=UPI001E662027|nr:uncharacterized protein LOC123706577 isoform X1 [Pieris brassicae]XP_045511817.1 uncharacterized protein LOC123706577 isoform X1 [Pieris brassicae]